ncbi:MAG TPA: Rrf2 family transcriptional regulator [Candidatus Tectomicrobia bacterium]|nr:Rrf2 family transcriptional regulator [Candidatus Tectomicrobia bacterium]
MRVSAKGEYAIRAVLDLAMRRGRELVPIQAIAARQGIPQRYLEQVLLALKRAGLLVSKRGAAGGYHLARAPEAITVGDVLRAVEGRPSFDAVSTAGRNGGAAELAELWDEIAEAVERVVDRWTVAELVERAHERRSPARYHI